MRTSLITAACLYLAFGAAACGTGGPPPPVNGPFDGIWASKQLGYEFLLDGRIGRAIRSNQAAIHVNDQVFDLLALDGDLRGAASLLMPDGTWRAVICALDTAGRLECGDGKSSITLERK